MTAASRDASAAVEKPVGEVALGRWTRADLACVVGIVVLATLFSLPTISSRPLHTSHDAKAGLIARRMLEGRQWFVGEISLGYNNKPPVYFWLVAGLSWLAGGVKEWTVRFPSVLACVGAALATWALARSVWDRWTGVASAAILVTLVHFHFLAQSARLDSVVTVSVTAAVFCFWKSLTAQGSAWHARGWWWSLGAYLSLAVGVAVKGPIAVVLAGLATAGVLAVRWATREGRPLRDIVRLHPLSGLALVLVLAAPVFWGMDRASGGRFLRYFLLRENLARAGLQVAGVEAFGKSYPFLYYLETIGLHAAPWSIFLPAALVLSFRRLKTGRRTAQLLPIAAFVLPFLFLSAVPVKKWSYIMPILPLVAMLLGRLWTSLMADGRGEGALVRWLMRLAAAFLVAVTLVMLAGTIWLLAPEALSGLVGPEGLIHTEGKVALPYQFRAVADVGLVVLVPLSAVAVCLAAGAIAIFRRRFRLAFVLLLCGTVLGTVCHDRLVRTVSSSMSSQRAFARRVEQWLAQQDGSYGSAVYVCAGEPYELVFYLREDARAVRRADAEGFLARIRPADSAAPGTPAAVVLSREWFDDLDAKLELREVLRTGERESRKRPLVLTTVKLTE